jgi:hypothetical protein
METSGKHISPRLTFAAGVFLGAIAVFVPLASAGHSGSPGAGRSSAPVAGPSAVDTGSSSSMKQDSVKSNEPSNEATCDVQLD